MFEWSISAGNIATMVVAFLSFLGASVHQAMSIGRYIGQVEKRLEGIDNRMGKLEEAEERQTEIVIQIAQQKTELRVLNDRISDIQKFGSHRLAEILESLRGQIMTEFRERFSELKRGESKERDRS